MTWRKISSGKKLHGNHSHQNSCRQRCNKKKVFINRSLCFSYFFNFMNICFLHIYFRDTQIRTGATPSRRVRATITPYPVQATQYFSLVILSLFVIISSIFFLALINFFFKLLSSNSPNSFTLLVRYSFLFFEGSSKTSSKRI